jgi:hypothetical protein
MAAAADEQKPQRRPSPLRHQDRLGRGRARRDPRPHVTEPKATVGESQPAPVFRDCSPTRGRASPTVRRGPRDGTLAASGVPPRPPRPAGAAHVCRADDLCRYRRHCGAPARSRPALAVSWPEDPGGSPRRPAGGSRRPRRLRGGSPSPPRAPAADAVRPRRGRLRGRAARAETARAEQRHAMDPATPIRPWLPRHDDRPRHGLLGAPKMAPRWSWYLAHSRHSRLRPRLTRARFRHRVVSSSHS